MKSRCTILTFYIFVSYIHTITKKLSKNYQEMIIVLHRSKLFRRYFARISWPAVVQDIWTELVMEMYVPEWSWIISTLFMHCSLKHSLKSLFKLMHFKLALWSIFTFSLLLVYRKTVKIIEKIKCHLLVLEVRLHFSFSRWKLWQLTSVF